MIDIKGTWLEIWLAMSNEKKTVVYAVIDDAKHNQRSSSLSMEAWNKVKDDITTDELSLIAYCYSIKDLPKSVKWHQQHSDEVLKGE